LAFLERAQGELQKTAMGAYKVYQTSGGRIHSAPRIIEADSDEAAIAEARQLVDGCDVELWNGKRLVTTLQASPHPQTEKQK